MKKALLLLLILVAQFSFAQEKVFTVSIPQLYEKATEIAVVNQKQDTILKFHRTGKKNVILSENQESILKNRRKLFNQNNELIATYKNHKIRFENGREVLEEKKKNAWVYSENGKEILEVSYRLAKKEKTYHLKINTSDLNKTTLSVLKFSLGKFEKRVIMDYDGDSDNSFLAIIFSTFI